MIPKKLVSTVALFLIFINTFGQNIRHDWHLVTGSNASYEESGTAVATDDSGNVYLTGVFYSTIDTDRSVATTTLTSKGESDIAITKYNKEGEHQWSFSIGGNGLDRAENVVVDQNNSVYVTGSFEGSVDFDPSAAQALKTSAGLTDIFVAKYSSDGAFQWVINLGGTGYDAGIDVGVGTTGEVFVTGQYAGTVDFDPGSGASYLTTGGIFVAKYSSVGVYAGVFSLMNTTGSNWVAALALDTQNNLYITGIFQGTVDFNPSPTVTNRTSQAGLGDAFLAKYSGALAFQWAFGIGNTEEEHGYDLVTDALGNVYVTGVFLGTVDFDPASATANLTSTAHDDIFVAKYSTSGAYQWAFGVADVYSFARNGLAIALDKYNDIYLAGIFLGTADFDPSAGTKELIATNDGTFDVFIAKYRSEDGNFIDALAMKGQGVSFASAIAIDPDNNFYLTGYFYNSMDIDPAGDGQVITSQGFSDIFLLHGVIPFTDFREAFDTELNNVTNMSFSNSWADYDNDGDQDLIVGTSDAGLILYENQGNRKFVNKNGTAINNTLKTVYGSTWGDYDNDGDADLFATDNDLSKPNALFRNNGNGNFSNVTNGDMLGEVTYSQSASWADYDLDGELDLIVANWHYLYPEKTNSLYKGNGSSTFTKMPGAVPASSAGAASGGAAWSDYDGDNLPDLFISNVAFQKDLLYRNAGSGEFISIKDSGLTSEPSTTVSAAWGDYDNDGDPDLYESRNIHDVLYRNDGAGNFEAVHTDLFDHELSDGASWGDFDNDGDLDLFLANGGGMRLNSIFRNDGNGSFTKLPTSTAAAVLSNSRAATAVDADQDGDLDIFISNVVGRNSLLENPGNDNHWLELNLHGVQSNRLGVGAKIRVKTGETWQLREVFSQEGSTLISHFGLGSASAADIVRVEWPSGNVQIIRNLSANQIITIHEANTPNQAHILASLKYDGQEDGSISFNSSSIANGFKDDEGDKLKQITITTLPSHGILSLNGQLVTTGQSISLRESLNFTFVPEKDWNGTTTVGYNATDNRNLTVPAIVALEILPVNDEPVFTIDDVELQEDFENVVVLTPVARVPSDETSQQITYTISPSNISFASIALDPTTGVVTIASLADRFGTQVFTITANDGQADHNIYETSFTVTVLSVYDPPICSDVEDLYPTETDLPTSAEVEITIVDASSEIHVTAESENKFLIPDESISISQNGNKWNIHVDIPEHKSGECKITLKIDDGISVQERSFTIFLPEITGLEENTGNDHLYLYPNPTSGDLGIVFDGHLNAVEANYTVINSKGTIVHQGALIFSSNHFTLPTDELAPGIYILKVTTDQGQLRALKFLKR